MYGISGSVFDAKEYTNVNFARCFAFTGAGIPINGQFALGILFETQFFQIQSILMATQKQKDLIYMQQI